MKKAVKRALLVAGVVVIAGGVAMLPKKAGGRPVQQVEESIYAVQTQKVSRSNLQEYLSLNGNIQTNNTISVYPDIAGKIKSVRVTLGSNVKRGSVIATVDPSVPGSIYAESPIYAPISGKITSLPLTTGTAVTTSSAIAQIGTTNGLQIKAMVPERDVAVLKNGLSAEISLVAFSGEVFNAKVNKVSPILDETSRTKEIYLLFDTEDERINAGMYAKIKLFTTLHENVITAPYDCVTTIDKKTYVYVATAEGTAELREVQLGAIVDGTAEIVSGLNDGEDLIVSGVQALDNGVKIRKVEVSK
ncbi:efflux RND transporter periplasmic adaptor subunit [Treponema zioleckii]|uniref:efflux RND transporter periplasmic adaptor subunit n=1 Tax=Treponema zioleckii TaxID=331680 RepID=UPI001F5B7C6E|nr:efflux RND transporter periplasmic adaptor subunit [Treponema zioleckii]